MPSSFYHSQLRYPEIPSIDVFVGKSVRWAGVDMAVKSQKWEPKNVLVEVEVVGLWQGHRGANIK